MKKIAQGIFLLIGCFSPNSFARIECNDPLVEREIQKTVFRKSKIKLCDKILDVEIADSDRLRSIGLMCRKSMSENSAMLFVFDEEKHLSFWMKNTLIPLSIGFLSKDKKLQEVQKMTPLDEKTTNNSKEKALYALETNVGWFEKNKIRAGKAGCKFVFIDSSTGQQSPRP